MVTASGAASSLAGVLAAANRASRSASTALICSRSSSIRSSSRPICVLKWHGHPSPVAGANRLEPRPPIAPQRRVVGYPLREQKALDPVHMGDPLGDQRRPFAAKPPPVLLFRRGRHHHRADPRLAALVGEKRPQQRLAVKPIRLGAPAPPRRRGRSGVDHLTS